jgi:glycerate 2-kinase
MRVLVAPGEFAGMLTAVEAADAIAEGWRRTAGDEITTVPMGEGGPGFVDVVHAAVGGELLAATVRGPLGSPVPATLLVAGHTAYVESAQVCGLALLPSAGAVPRRGVVEEVSTYGVGELVTEAVAAGARRIVVGVGGSGSNDGGAGLLAALGATSEPAGALTASVAGLAELTGVELGPARARVAGIELVAASDVDNPLLGLRGTTNVFGVQKGLGADRLVDVDGALTRFAHLAGREPADAKGAGAGGGLGYGVLLVGGRIEPGFAFVADTVGLDDAVGAADVVVTGSAKLDWQGVSGNVVAGIAQLAGRAMRPCIVIAGDVQVGARELRAKGIESAYSLVELAGTAAAGGDPVEAVATVAARVARTWSRR